MPTRHFCDKCGTRVEGVLADRSFKSKGLKFCVEPYFGGGEDIDMERCLCIACLKRIVAAAKLMK